MIAALDALRLTFAKNSKDSRSFAAVLGAELGVQYCQCSRLWLRQRLRLSGPTYVS
jgi:hypothetical protein